MKKLFRKKFLKNNVEHYDENCVGHYVRKLCKKIMLIYVLKFFGKKK